MPKTPQGAEPALVQEFLQGDPAAYRAVDRWIDLVLKDRFSSLREEWDDLRQEIRMRILRNLQSGSFHGTAALRTYVHRLATNVCIDSQRKAYRRREQSVASDSLPAPDDSEHTAIAEWIDRDLLSKALACMTAADRTIAVLVLQEAGSSADLARCLGISVSAVRKRLLRCRVRLLERASQIRR